MYIRIKYCTVNSHDLCILLIQSRGWLVLCIRTTQPFNIALSIIIDDIKSQENMFHVRHIYIQLLHSLDSIYIYCVSYPNAKVGGIGLKIYSPTKPRIINLLQEATNSWGPMQIQIGTSQYICMFGKKS